MTLASEAQWHLDKRVPIALVFAIFMQTVAAVWWASGVQHQLTDVAQISLTVPRLVSTLERLDERMTFTERRLQESLAAEAAAQRERSDLSRSVAVLNAQVMTLAEAINHLTETLKENTNDLRRLQNGNGDGR